MLMSQPSVFLAGAQPAQIFLGSNLLSLREQQYFGWDTASQSKMKNARNPGRSMAPLATPIILAAGQLLMKSNFSIFEIAYMCGHFRITLTSRNFRSAQQQTFHNTVIMDDGTKSQSA